MSIYYVFVARESTILVDLAWSNDKFDYITRKILLTKYNRYARLDFPAKQIESSAK